MEFGSIVFLLRFLPIFIAFYYVVPGRMKSFILLLGSLCFYAWRVPIYVVLLLATAVSDYCHGLLIEKYKGKRTAGIILGNALFFDSALLLFFGYADFLIGAINAVTGLEISKFDFPIPLGLTIFIFQSMSYVIDVFRGNVEAQRNLISYAAFVTMFPQMPGGPIVCYRDVEQTLRIPKPELHQISGGAKRFCIGLAKKVLLADLAGELWMGVESLGVSSLSMGTAWLGVFAFAFRMYYAYSGLADMAIGIGMCLGFSLPESFRYPFAASSVTDFLHRWNMSLVIWVKEYVFRGNVPGRLFGAFLAWSLMGLWYGPDGTFLLWGVWLAVFYVLETIFWKRVQKALPFVVNWLLTMLVISVGWVFFALNDMESVKIYLYALFGQGAAGLMDDHFWYLLSEYFPVMSLGIVFALPQLSMLIRCLREGRSGLSMALYRFGEKTVPAILLLLSLLKIVGE